MSRLVSFYGDDFTGSTDVMEALASHGVATVLFTRIPSPEAFAPFAGYEAMGLAGTSRSRSPQWMEENLPAAFEWLMSTGPEHLHYKICSTCDSAPHVGNIAKAAEIGLRIARQTRTPLVVGSPTMKRYTFAGHLFAAYRDRVYRIDRHPVMSVHPVTPMNESDLRLHLAKQGDAEFYLLDVYDSATLLAAGQELQRRKGFVVGSSGVENALLAALGRRPDARFAPISAVDRLLVVSGSVSPTTQRQIEHACASGFASVAADAMSLVNGDDAEVLANARAALSQGRSAVIHSASGPASDRSAALAAIPDGREMLSRTLGRIMRALIEEFRLKRVVVAGGDTASHALEELVIHALTTRFPLAKTPGSPLCVAHSASTIFDGLEIALKGGQIGDDGYFTQFRDGIVSQ